MYTVNYELSCELAAEYPSAFKPNHCYENVFELVCTYEPGTEQKVLFCYVMSGGLYLRHAFCVVDGQIVEPLQHIREEMDVSSIVPVRELSVMEYEKLIIKDRRYDLFPSLYKKEIDIFNRDERLRDGLNPIDLSGLVTVAAKSPKDMMRILDEVSQGKGINIAAE